MVHWVENSLANGEPLVSVIIPVRDDPAGIRQVLDCLAKQSLPSKVFEVVIGDDGSHSDLRPQIATEKDRVRCVWGPPRTSYAARNMAAAVSQGSILAFCDADCFPEPRWLEEGVAALEDAEVVAGQVRFRAPAQPTLWSYLTTDLFLDQQQNVSLLRGVTASLFVRRVHFEEFRGFDQSLPSGGDYDFVGRMVKSGARLKYSPLSVLEHPTMDRAHTFLSKVFKTNFWSGVRHARDRDKLELAAIFELVPIFGVMYARRRALRPALQLCQERLEISKMKPTSRTRFLAVAALYSVVSLVAGAGRVLGWLKGARLARAPTGAIYASNSPDQVLEMRGSDE